MKSNQFLMTALSVLVSSLLISCASTPEMSAEEERAAVGQEFAISASPMEQEMAKEKETATTEAPAEEAPAEETQTASNEVKEEAPAAGNSGRVSIFDPGIASSEPEAKEEVKKEEAAPEKLPLSGELASKEEAAPSDAPPATVDSSLDNGGMNTPSESNEPSLAMPSFGEPSLVTPKKKKARRKKATQVSEETVTTPAPVAETAPVAPVVDTQNSVDKVANQVTTPETTKMATTSGDSVVEKDGVKMNRYYFLRPGDHTEKVSELLYGNRNMADKLLNWNGGIEQWVPGNMIWYNSPVQKDDTTMTSFYEESKVSMKEHKVQKGENLKVLAARFYGDIRCWSELAHINHLGKDSASVAEGATLKFAPEKLGTITIQAEAVKATDTDEQDPFLAADREREAKEKDKNKKSLASAEVGNFLMNNLFLILSVTLALGLIVFMMKRKGNDPMEF